MVGWRRKWVRCPTCFSLSPTLAGKTLSPENDKLEACRTPALDSMANRLHATLKAFWLI